MRLIVRTPATAANLGPGFDALALALGLHNEVVCETPAEPAVEVEGEGAGELPEDASNLIFRSMTYFAREVGGSLPPLGLRCRNGIPLERGLGSSASAVVTGVLLADRLIGAGLDPDRLLGLAVDVEGHPDNVAACFRGGGVIAYLSRDGWRAERLDPHPDLRPVVLIPEGERVPTQDARRVLPVEVPLRDAAFNVGRSALAVRALTYDPVLLHEALEDRLHQARRLNLAPKARALFRDLREADVPACLSGAGPTILAFEGVGGPIPELGPGWRVERPGVAAEGASIVEED
ncbi:MAG TPA: homoserine kinase [Actinomycetota bacterium]|nr:homoserine kinase [Actinomycetota bacterium]